MNYRGLQRAEAIRDQLLGLLRHHNIPIKSCKENGFVLFFSVSILSLIIKNVTFFVFSEVIVLGELNSILQCLVRGFFSQAAYYDYSGDYVTVRNKYHFKVYKGSAIMYKREFPKWFVKDLDFLKGCKSVVLLTTFQFIFVRIQDYIHGSTARLDTGH